MPRPILYSFRRCPYAMRARLALLAAGQVVEHREVALKNKPAEMLRVSPKGTVPVLVLADGTVLEESLDIMRWALGRSDPQGWLGGDEAGREDAWSLIAQNDGDFKFHLDRYKYPHRYGLADGTAHRELARGFLDLLQARLAQHGFLAGAHFGLADAAIAPFVRQFAHTDPVWFAAQAWTHLAQWLQDFEASAAFAQVMEKHPVWPGASGRAA
ncbi:MAG: glutathione S-transferase [Betaproteobacteria bacterium]|nr:glutathione S-transferase [Betaproteobacteria bacterium]